MLLRQTLLYLPAQLLAPLFQVVAAVVWTHWLSPSAYGVLTFLIAGQDLVFLFCLSWWTQFTLRYIAGLDAPARAAFRDSEASVIALSVPAQVVGTLLVVGFLHQPSTPELAAAAITYVVSRTLVTHLGERARAQGRIAIYSLGQTASSALGFAVALFAVSRLADDAEAVLYGFAVAQAVSALAMWWRLGVSLRMRPRRATIAAALRYGLPLLVAGCLAWLAQNGIRLVVEKLAGAEALGLVAVGWGLGQRLAATLAMLVIAASFPLAVKEIHGGSRSEAFRQIALGGSLLTGLIVPASIGLSLLAEPFANRFVAVEFRAATIAILPLAAACGAVRNIRMHIADPIFLLIERPSLNTVINMIDVATLFLGCTAGLLVHGLVGAVEGALIGTVISTVSGFAIAHRLAGFAFPYRHGLRIAAASAAMAAVLLAVPWRRAGLPALERMLIEVIVGAAAYLAAIAALYPRLIGEALRRFDPRAATS